MLSAQRSCARASLRAKRSNRFPDSVPARRSVEFLELAYARETWINFALGTLPAAGHEVQADRCVAPVAVGNVDDSRCRRLLGRSLLLTLLLQRSANKGRLPRPRRCYGSPLRSTPRPRISSPCRRRLLRKNRSQEAVDKERTRPAVGRNLAHQHLGVVGEVTALESGFTEFDHGVGHLPIFQNGEVGIRRVRLKTVFAFVPDLEESVQLDMTRGPIGTVGEKYHDRADVFQPIDVARQEVMTRDNVPVTVDAVLYFRVIDPQAAVVKVEDFLKATSLIAQTTLRSVLGQAELDELLARREKINLTLQEIIDRQTDPWGVKVTAVEVKDVSLPDTMKRAMAKQAEAERERRAKVVNAEGEFQAAEKMVQAAAMISKQPIALQLRFLQTMREISSEHNTTTFLPVPIDMFSPFKQTEPPKS